MKKKTSAAEYMKIRRYVLNRIHRANNRMIQLPTARELAELFGCSRPTVGKAMKMLADDGYVIGKPGIGSFTNPAKIGAGKGNNLEHLPIIGIIIGDGMLVHYDTFFGTVLSQVLERVIHLPAILHIINLTSTDPEQIAREILAEELDGLLWHVTLPLPDGIMPRLRKAGLPAVAMGNGVTPDADGFYFDMDTLGREIAQHLLAQGRKHVVFLADQEPWNQPRHSLLKTYADAGMPLNEKLFLGGCEDGLAKLKEFLEVGAPIDAVFNPIFRAGKITGIFASLGIDCEKNCTLVNNDISPDSAVPGGLTYHLPIREVVEQAVDHLSGLLGRKTFPPPQQFPVHIPLREFPGTVR